MMSSVEFTCENCTVKCHKNGKKKSHNVLSKLVVLCWAAHVAILDHRWPVDHELSQSHRCSQESGWPSLELVPLSSRMSWVQIREELVQTHSFFSFGGA